MTMLAPSLAAPLRSYAAALHSAILAEAGRRGESGHHVASPLGAWLLLGLVARAGQIVAGSAAGDALSGALGCPLAQAAELTERLLSQPARAVPTAAVAWLRESVHAPALSGLMDQFPCQTGPMPSQSEADDWVRRHTDGLLTHYPVSVSDPEVLLTMATALSARVRWQQPFELVEAAELHPGPFAAPGGAVLRAERGAGHELSIQDTSVGLVALHVGVADGLRVVSVAADPHVPADQVLEAAYELASGGGREVNPWDLAVGAGPAWTITEEPDLVFRERAYRFRDVTLPAWSARGSLDLIGLGSALGFPAAGQLLAPLLALDDYDLAAAQSVMARFHREGFQAAAVTAFAARGGGIPPTPQPGRCRVVRLRFAHPYAVVALVDDFTDAGGRRVPGPWHLVPVFGAWVAQADHPE